MYMRNRNTAFGLEHTTTPYEVMFGRKPILSYFRVFGSRCWYNLPRSSVDKRDPFSQKLIMIGCSRAVHGCKIWDVSGEKVIISRNVWFDELNEYEHIPGTAEESVPLLAWKVEPDDKNPLSEGDVDKCQEHTGTTEEPSIGNTDRQVE